MNLPANNAAIPPSTAAGLAAVREFERHVLSVEQIPISTDHVIHGGMYARTIMIPAGVALTGALIKLPTILIVNGFCTIATGGDPIHVDGYSVIPASAMRKSAFVAHEDTYLTMIFPTGAKTVSDAEIEFTDETEMLFSHTNANTITITGE